MARSQGQPVGQPIPLRVPADLAKEEQEAPYLHCQDGPGGRPRREMHLR